MSLITSKSFLSPKAKSKVVRFSLNYDLKNLFLDVVNEKDRHLYEEFICKIRDLGQEIRDDELVQILKEARNCISILDRNLILFVQVILLLRWSHRSEDVVREYQGFLLDLCSAHSYYSKNVIDHLVSYFKHTTSNFTDGLPVPEERSSFQNIHNVIKTILNVIPMTRDILMSSVSYNWPYIKRQSKEHASFIYNVLQIISYAPSFRLDILKVVTQKLVAIDVSVPAGESELRDSLDLCMNVYLTYIYNTCYEKDNLNFQATKILYSDIVKVFETTLISTYGTNHVQFIIFYLLSFKPIITVGFLQLLWSKVTNPNVAPIIRQTSVSYIASLLTRAAYIPVGLVRDMLSEMSNFVHSYIGSQESVTCVVQDTRIHGVFYSVCQAIFYIIAFRLKELVGSKRGLTFLNGLNLSKIVQSRLNPLKACDPVVAQNFANATRVYQLAYCYSILERNARSSLPQLARDHSGNETVVQPFLETFFPFDPYSLDLSGRFVKPIYREYNELSALEEPMQQDEEDDFIEPHMLSQSPGQSVLSQSPRQSVLSQSPRSNFLYGHHPGFLHIT